VPDAGEQKIIGLIQDLRASGLSLRQIAERLNQEGYVTRSGTSWKFQYVSNILERK
jgi:hypothetical protein